MFLGVDRDKSGRIGFFGSSGGTSGFGLQIGTVQARSGRLASMTVSDITSAEILDLCNGESSLATGHDVENPSF